MTTNPQRMVPTIACVKMATTPLGVDWDDLMEALVQYVQHYLEPIWGTPAKISEAGLLDPGTEPKKLSDSLSEKLSGKWGMLFLDDADDPNALGYHDLTPEGLPLSKVFVRTTLDDRRKVSVTAAHELAEMLVDPGIQMGAIGPDGQTWYAYEIADAVGSDDFKIGRVAVSSFLYPAWFEGFRAPKSAQFDYLGECKRPFELRPDGYMPVFKDGNWTQIFGSQKAEERFNHAHHPRMQARPRQMRYSWREPPPPPPTR